MKRGFTAGAFDLCHAGHVMLFKEAKKHCDELMVALHIDPSGERPEKHKPIQTAFERYMQLESNCDVDYIVPYETEKDLLALLIIAKPDIRFLGSDYIDKPNFTGAELNIPIHYVNRGHGFSSSELRKRIAQ